MSLCKAVCSGWLFLVLSSFGQTPDSISTPPQKSFGPVTEYNAALPNSNDVLRFRRGERYNSPNSPLPELGNESDPVLVTEETASYHHDPMPFAQSDAVVVGRVESGQAYLSNDKRDIYSEFKITLEEVLRSPTSRHIQVGDNIDVERQGGEIQLPSKRILIRGSKDFSMPIVGKRHLLFLRFNQTTEDFHIVRGYVLEGQHTYNLDELGYGHSDRHHDAFVHPLIEEGHNEGELLDRARSAAPPAKGGN